VKVPGFLNIIDLPESFELPLALFLSHAFQTK